MPSGRRPAHFEQFVARQRALVAGAQGEEHRRYWQQQLDGAPSSLPLATDHPRPLSPLGPGAARNFIVKGPIVEELKGLARAEGTTLFSVLLAAFNVLLHQPQRCVRYRHRHADERRARGRNSSAWSDYLVNALPIRTRLRGDDPFAQLVAQVDATIRTSLEHQDYPFPMIVRDVAPPREPGRSPSSRSCSAWKRFDSADPRAGWWRRS